MRARLKIVVFGLSLSSSWGNGHASTYRGLLRALSNRGHDVLFLERDRPWYANARDLRNPSFCRLRYYRDPDDLERFRSAVESADAVIVGSYVPDGIQVADWVFSTALSTVAFYDIDTPITLATLANGDCEYISPAQVPRYDLYLSFTGGSTLSALKKRWGATAPHALYCSADTEVYRPLESEPSWALGYLGTYSPDRQRAIERFIIEPALRAPHRKFVVAGAQYPNSIVWPENVERIEHIPPHQHARFYCSLEWALNVTRSDMRKAGFSPSVRLFEAAACGTPIVSDWWKGLETFFEPGEEIVIAKDADDVLSALSRPALSRQRLGAKGRRAVLRRHTSVRRAAELEALLMRQGSMRREFIEEKGSEKIGERDLK